MCVTYSLQSVNRIRESRRPANDPSIQYPSAGGSVRRKTGPLQFVRSSGTELSFAKGS